MNRKLELAKKKKAQKQSEELSKRELVEKQIVTLENTQKAVDSLYELLNGQEQYDFDKLHDQLVEIDKRLDLAPIFKSLEKSIKSISHNPTDKTKIEGFSELLKAVKANKVTVNVDLKKLEKTVVEISQFIRDQSKPSDQGAEDFQPVRRVVKIGNRFLFDDNLTSGGGSSGGPDVSGLATITKQDEIITAIGNINDGTGTSDVTSVADTASSATLKAANTNRRQIIIQNTSSAVLYVKYGTTATSSDFTVRLAQYDILIEDEYNGRIDGIWASDPGDGAAKVTEIT